jgi:hypothetical protein
MPKPRTFTDQEEQEIGDDVPQRHHWDGHQFADLAFRHNLMQGFPHEHKSTDNLPHSNLWFIPPGLTRELQPLDRFVFGAMKRHVAGSIARIPIGTDLGAQMKR